MSEPTISLATLNALQARARMLDGRLEALRIFFAKHRDELRPVIAKLSLEEQLQLSLTIGAPGKRVACVGKSGPLLSIVPKPCRGHGGCTCGATPDRGCTCRCHDDAA